MKTAFVITVDVETRSQRDPAQDILGNVSDGRENFGIGLMMDLLDRHQARATFFLNAYEIATHGDAVIAQAARMIHSRGHDLALHTHPRPMYRFYGVSGAPFVEQVEILEKGISLIEKWTGKRVTSHRAGAFCANADTLRAAEATELVADCSFSPASRGAMPLIEQLGASNVACRVGKVWEIPVTYYCQLRVGSWRPRRILDIEASSLAEIKCVTRQAMRQGLPTVCILMHSFSFVRHGRPDRRVIRRFAALLAWLAELDGIETGTVQEVCRHLDTGTMPRSTPRPLHTGFWLTWHRALLSWRDGWKNITLAVAGIAVLAAPVFLAVYLGFVLSQAIACLAIGVCRQ